MKTVSEIAKRTGCSVRTLHYYDEIGLLRPTEVTATGYRLYDDAALARLQQILFYRELDFSLAEIARILNDPSFEPRRALKQHRTLLRLKRERLDRLLRLVDETLKGDCTMSFTEFDTKEIDETRRRYAKEAKERWGNTEAWAQSNQRTGGYSKEEWARITAEANSIYSAFAACMGGPPDSPAAQEQVHCWQEHISRWYYDCTDDILMGLAELYTSDERFAQSINAHTSGLAQFMSGAIRAHK